MGYEWLALAELVGLVALMIVSGALVAWGCFTLMPPRPRPPRRRKRGKR